MVPDMSVTMVIAAECQPAVKMTDQVLACLQALSLDAVGPRLPREDCCQRQEGLDLQAVKDAAQTALAFIGNVATQFSIRGQRSSRHITRTWCPFLRNRN